MREAGVGGEGMGDFFDGVVGWGFGLAACEGFSSLGGLMRTGELKHLHGCLRQAGRLLLLRVFAFESVRQSSAASRAYFSGRTCG